MNGFITDFLVMASRSSNHEPGMVLIEYNGIRGEQRKPGKRNE